MKKSHESGLATHIGPESCGAARKGGVEALTRAGRVFSPSGPMVETSKCNILFRLRSRSSSFVDDLLQLSAQEVVLQPRIALFVRPQRVGNGREVIY